MKLHRRTPVCRALQTLDAHLSHIHTVDCWARLHGYTRAAFTRAVQVHYGRTPGALLRIHRLERARRILTTENVKFHEVALRVGLPNAGALNHLVKASLGFPPSQWKDRLRAGL